jgi:Nucleotidyl transferase AbiEii toxin, Type IV TA system
MNLGEQLELLKQRGFDQDQAQVVILIREAAIILFQAFPDLFLMQGGANLILFHGSLRTSRDLDLLLQGAPLPRADDVTRVLSEELLPLGSLLGVAPLKISIEKATPAFIRIEVTSKDDRSLFTVDLGGLGSVLGSGIDEHVLEAVSLNTTATIKSVSRDHLLLQKAEAFVFRPGIKVRDAYDIKLLMDAGALLNTPLERHLSDALAMREIGRNELMARIEQVTPKLCRAHLSDVLPAGQYATLERANFEPLVSALRKVFQTWL